MGVENVTLIPVVQPRTIGGASFRSIASNDNPDGLGDQVSDGIIYSPWLMLPAGEARSASPLALGQFVLILWSCSNTKITLFVTTTTSLLVEVTPSDTTEGNGSWAGWHLPFWTIMTLTHAQDRRGTYELLIAWLTREPISSPFIRNVSDPGAAITLS
jgi:hypothetical protein